MGPDPKLASKLFAQAILRIADVNGDFSTILKSGDPVSGAILLCVHRRYANPEIYEARTGLDGKSGWHLAKHAEKTDINGESPGISNYLAKRQSSDPDLWVIELNIASDERLDPYLALLA
jgi:hypothetical protein